MAKFIELNKMTDTMDEGVLVKWNIKVGDTVKPGDLIADVETDKATMELENFEKGTILKLLVEEGTTLPVNTPIAIIGEKGEDFSGLLEESKAESKKDEPSKSEKSAEPETKEETQKTVSSTKEVAVSTPQNGDERLKASPLAKKLASEKGIDIHMIAGTGEGGRIIKKDIENYKPSAQGVQIAGKESYDELPVSQMRKTIAARLAESKFTSPHFYLTIEIDMDKAQDARKTINDNGDIKISVNDMIVKASALALKKHPYVNGSWLGDKIRLNHHVHIGVAVAVEEGLLVPVVRFADQKSFSQISAEVKEYSAKAKDKKLQPSDWQGNTFTISNLGMFGIEEFTAIINPPDSCILAVGGVKQVVAVAEDGSFYPKQVMKVTLSCDHRLVDGVSGSKFLQTLKSYLEEPVRMLV